MANFMVQVTSLSFSLESGDVGFEGNVDPIKDRIPRDSHVTQHRMSSVIEPFEVASLPLGLAEDGDSISRSPLSLRQRSEAERVFLSSHRPMTSLRPSSVAAISNALEFSSSHDLTPLSVITFKEEKSQRNIWLDNAGLMAMSLALCNIWRLPTFIYFNYSGEAFIAYIILMVFVGLPLFVLELSLGQFGQTGVIKLWRAVPFFKGIGVAQMIAGLYQASYIPTLITWAFQSGILGFGGWNGCESSSQNLTACLCQEPGSTDCSLYGVISEEEFCFASDVLYKYNGHINYKMLPMLAAVLILVALCISFGAKIMKIILTLSGVICAILLSVALALALSHPNNSQTNSNNTAQIGINLLAPTEPWGFGRGEVWYGAMVQVIFSLAIGFGTLPSLSSSTYFSRNTIRDGILIWLINILFAVLSVITTFAWIGISGLHAKDVVQPNAFIYFIYYNISNSLWAGLAFGLIFLSGLNSMLPLMYAIIQNLYENFPVLEQKRYQKLTYCLLFIAVWLINIPGLIPAGNEVVTMWDHYAAGGTVLTCLIIHLIGWLWVYGGKNLKRDFEFMINRSINSFWNVFWSYVTIIVLVIAELWGFLGVPLDGTTDCLYPIWMVATGWSFYLLALAVACAVAIKTVVHETEYELIKKLTNSMKADRHWGPIDPLLHFHWKRSIESPSGPVPYSMDTISRRLKVEDEQKIETDISLFDQNSMPKSHRASITMVRLPHYERHYDENGHTID
ncbi:sodium-dependent noradrenaline transporter-like isoform X2 [Daphnia pulicaria]|uniref:sodium-dependent noradrenaline transporter-like isoform X2 n=1 Tax=Daphnia pulicaria TaxID=35523 RepID=UPI001EEB288B|nr:sodium-dependent noradrenaline transporter-like isoform X2 [Daphnia pulicaria]